MKNFKISFIIMAVLLATKALLASPLGSTELINNAKKYDGKTVTYSGEAIGEIMKRGNFSWANINNGDNAVGIWMPDKLADQIKFYGNYKTKGDVVEISGIFNRACPEHGGDLDIHARSIRKISEGLIVEHKVDLQKKKIILILLGVLFFVWILSLFKRK